MDSFICDGTIEEEPASGSEDEEDDEAGESEMAIYRYSIHTSSIF